METPALHDSEYVPAAPAGVWRRIWKYKLHYVIVIPAMLLIFLFKLFPLFAGILMSFKDYRPFRGMFGSPWVGLGNFAKLFEATQFRNALANTLIFKLEYVAATGILSLVVALAVSSIMSRRVRNIVSVLALAPYFIPSAVAAYAVMLALMPERLENFGLHFFVLGDPGLFRPMLVIVEAFKTCGIPIMMILAAIGSRKAATAPDGGDGAMRGESWAKTHMIPALRVISAFAVLQLSAVLSTDFDLLVNLINPLVRETSETLETYAYMEGLLMGRYATASAAWLLQFAVQAVCTLVAYFLLKRVCYTDLFYRTERSNGMGAYSKGRNAAGIAVSAIFSLVVLAAIYYICLYPFTVHSAFGASVWRALPATRYLGFMLICFAAVIVNLFITITLAYPLTVKDLPGRRAYKAILLIAMAAGAGTSLPEFLLAKSMGMVGTMYPQMVFGIFAIINVFVVKSIFNSKYAELKERAAAAGRGELHSFFALFLPKMWKPLIALGVLQFVSLWNGYQLPLLYTVRPDAGSPLIALHSLSIGKDVVPFGDPAILQLAAVICVPPLALLLIFRKWLTSEVLIGQTRKL
ncbi:hypothetical protein SD70_25885 [Gordoniibacillus kamchatkensis]|uniref:Uncharacterized protein n=1 Tax=Gordoniibacillus kamchatkensis TaxID=1590651 RepID=A0ABR5AC59_9BACL|nr:hypothetical protein [Paenibacillus sp. VKM B-2647]KIL38556.1 hypothetical protein SD70_25885 [Paenibacillus sp. VKM B-2647]